MAEEMDTEVWAQKSEEVIVGMSQTSVPVTSAGENSASETQAQAPEKRKKGGKKQYPEVPLILNASQPRPLNLSRDDDDDDGDGTETAESPNKRTKLSVRGDPYCPGSGVGDANNKKDGECSKSAYNKTDTISSTQSRTATSQSQEKEEETVEVVDDRDMLLLAFIARCYLFQDIPKKRKRVSQSAFKICCRDMLTLADMCHGVLSQQETAMFVLESLARTLQNMYQVNSEDSD